MAHLFFNAEEAGEGGIFHRRGAEAQSEEMHESDRALAIRTSA